MRSLPHDYEERVYAGWLGKCIGVRFGAPLESWTYREIKDNLGDVERYLPMPPGKIFKPDDDTAGPLVLIRALEDYGPEVTAEQMGETVLNYIADQRGTFWWGGYGVSTEHTAYANLAAGIKAPLSGSAALNGTTVAEQIGGQIFSDIWGLVAPNDPALAARYAAKAASVSHDGNAIYGGMFIAALVSAAFGEAHPERLIEAGLAVIPGDSEYTRVTRAVIDFYRQNPYDWRAAYAFINEHFGYHRYPGVVHIIPNAGIIIMALLYGQGDFSRTIQIANMGGWDTDCNVGNVGAIMGVAVGLAGIPWSWREPMNDILVAASVSGTRNLTDMAACADLFCRLGRQIAGQPTQQRARYHFDYPGSTQSLTYASKGADVAALQQVSLPAGGGALKVTVRQLRKKQEVRVSVPTYLRPGRLSANFYGASFSPKVYPGQTLHARVQAPLGVAEGLLAALYVWDDNAQIGYQAQGRELPPGEWIELSYAVPELRGACLSEAGVVLRTLSDVWRGSLLIDDLDWQGAPRFGYDFAKERPENGSISQWTFVRGLWRLENGGYHGSGPGHNETYSGDDTWRDYTLSATLTPLVGGYHNLNVRVHGARRSYAAGLAEAGQLVLYKNEGGYCPLASVPCEWRHGQAYRLRVAVYGNRLSVSVDGGVLLEWQDDAPLVSGQIGLSNFAGCHTRYEDVAVS